MIEIDRIARVHQQKLYKMQNLKRLLVTRISKNREEKSNYQRLHPNENIENILLRSDAFGEFSQGADTEQIEKVKGLLSLLS